jgi:hypothetical protein
MKKCLTLLLIVVGITGAFAQVPKKISYQGILTNASGTPVPNGTYNLVFGLYAASSGGSALWTETWNAGNAVQTTNGHFTVVLGSLTPLNLAFDVQYYLGVAISGGTELPRTALTTAPYSFRAAGVADNGVTSAAIAANAVTAAKITDEPGVAQIMSGPNTYRYLPTGTNSIDSITITPPAPGYVIVTAGLSATIAHTLGVEDEAYYQVRDAANTISFTEPGYAQLRVARALPTDTSAFTDYNFPVLVSRVFLVNAATPHKYYLNARVAQGWDSKDGWINSYMNAVYIPTAYGTIYGGGLGKFSVGEDQKRAGQ